jgi:hypothetical protein
MLMSNLLFSTSLRIIAAEGRDDPEPEWVKGIRRKLQAKIETYRSEIVKWGG